MALQLMKLLVVATTTTTVVPESTKFFYVTTADTAAGSSLTIAVDDFFTDSGDPATTLPSVTDGNSFFVVYVNGVLQMNGLSTYTDGGTGVGQLVIEVPVGDDPILNGSSVVLSIESFAPDSTTDVTT